MASLDKKQDEPSVQKYSVTIEKKAPPAASSNKTYYFQGSLLKPRDSQKTSYQQNVQSYTPATQTQKNSRSLRGTLSWIQETGKTDRKSAQTVADMVKQLMYDPSSRYYNPYASHTNRAVDALAELGVDMSAGVNDDFFNNYSWLTQYYKPTANTNSLSSTMTNKRASKEEKAAYYYHQLEMAEEKTKKAEQEWSAMQEELAYWANRTDLNMSDDEILGKIDWSKYKTLSEMDEAKKPGSSSHGTPMELNRAIGYSEDAMYATLWAARNGGGTGNVYQDMINSYNGVGNVWQDNPEISAKRDIGNLDTYSRYALGMTADDEGVYFGRSFFDQKWIDENRARYLGSGNETDAKMFNNVQAAEDYTQKLEKEYVDMNATITRLLANYGDAENGADTIIKLIRDNKEFKDLFDLDETLETGKLKKTNRAVDYRWKDVEARIRSECDKAKSKTSAEGVANEARGATTTTETPAAEATPEEKPKKGLIGSIWDGFTSWIKGGKKPELVPEAAPTPAPEATPMPSPTPTPWPETGPAPSAKITPGSVTTPGPTATPGPETTPAPTDDIGQYGAGNIDLYNRPKYIQEDGSISTINSISFSDEEGKEILIPTIVDGKQVTDEEAIQHYYETGEYLGKFDTAEEADAYAERLHDQQEQLYGETTTQEPVTTPEPTPAPTPAPTQKPVSTPPVLNEAEKALETQAVDNMNGMAAAVEANGTQAEKNAFLTSKTANFGRFVDEILGSTRDGVEWLSENTTKGLTAGYLDSTEAVYNYESHKANADRIAQRLAETEEEWLALSAKQGTTDQLGGLTSDDLAALQGLATNPPQNDEYWNGVVEVLSNQENEPEMNVNWALSELYSRVTGTDIAGNYEGEAAQAELRRAEDWWEYLNSGEAEKGTSVSPIDEMIRNNAQNDTDFIEEEIAIPNTNGANMQVTLEKDDAGQFQFVQAVNTATGETYGADQKGEVDQILGAFEPLTREESARLEELTRERDYLTSQQQMEQEFLDAEEASYQQALTDRNQMMEMYVEAALLAEANGQEFDLTPIYIMDYAMAVGQDDSIPDYLTNNIIDLQVQAGQLSREDATVVAQATTLGNLQTVEQLQSMLDTLDSLGVSMPEGWRANIESKMGYLQQDALSASYVLMDGVSGFQEGADAGREKAANGEYGRLAKAIATGTYGFEWEDLLGGLTVSSAAQTNKRKEVLQETIDVMTDEEKNRFFYLLETEGKEAADKYFNLLTDPDRGVLVARRSQDVQKQIRDFASQNALTAVAATGLSFVTNMIGGKEALIYEVTSKLSGKGINVYNPAFDAQMGTGALRGGVKDQLNNYYGKDTLGAQLANLLYDGFTSSGDSWINAQQMDAVFGAVSSFFDGTRIKAIMQAADIVIQSGDSKLAKFALKAGKDLTHASSMGLSAAASAYRDVIARHGSEEQAMRMAVATFWAETGSEAITVGNLHEAFGKGQEAVGEGLKGLLQEFVKNGGEEALGEGASEWITQNADRIIMGPLSEYEQTAQELIESGYPETVAYAIADQAVWKSILQSAATGFVSSGFGTVTEYARGKLTGSESTTEEAPLTETNVNEAVEEGQQVSPENPATITQEDVNEETSTEEEDTITPEQQRQDEIAAARVEEESNNAEADKQQFAKDEALLSSILTSSNPTAAAVSMTAVLGNTYGAREGVQTMIGDMAHGNPRLAAQTIHSILLAAPGNTAEVKQAVAQAALTDGSGHQVLATIMDTVAHGGSITVDNVNELVSSLHQDQAANPQAFQAGLQAGVTSARVATATVESFQTGEGAKNTKAASDAAAQAQQNVATAQQTLENAQADVASATDALNAAVDEQLQDAGNPALAAPVQQAAEQLEASMRNLEAQQNSVEAAQGNLEEAQKNAAEVQAEEMNKARAGALTTVEQQQQQEAEAAAQQAEQDFQNALATYPPTKAFSQPVTATKMNGSPIQLTGVFGFTNGDVTVYSTPNGYITDNEIDEYGDGFEAAFDAATAGWHNNDTPVHPAAWMDHSLQAVRVDTGEVVNLIGFAGQQDGIDPVVMDSNGNIYTSDQIHMQPDPFTGDNGNQALFEAFDAADGENLPEINAADLHDSTTAGDQNQQTAQDVESEDSEFGTVNNVSFLAIPGGTIAVRDENGLIGFKGITVTFSGNIRAVDENGDIHSLSDLQIDNPYIIQWILDNVDKLGQDNFDHGISMVADADTINSVKLYFNDVLQNPSTDTTTPTDVTTSTDVNDEYSEGKVNKKTGDPLKNWQDPKYHGKVEKTTKKVKPTSKAFKKFFGKNAPEAIPYVTNADGTPKLFYRGYGDFGKALYTVHQSKPVTGPDGKPMYLNFYMDKQSTAASYAGTNKIVGLRYSKNWETARAAMQDIGYDLVEAPNPDGSGQMGYQVTRYGGPATTNGSNHASTWFAENELNRFNATYGGELKHKGIHAGFVSLSKPLIIDGQGSNYTSVYSGPNGVTAPDGATFTGTQKTRRWAEWAFQHGYDSVIFLNVKDNVSGGGEVGTEIVTSASGQFKSVYNKGTWDSNDPNILAKANTQKSPQLLDVQEKLELGKPVEEMSLDERKQLVEAMMNTPEVLAASKNMSQMGDTLPYAKSNAIKKFDGSPKSIEALRTAGVPETTITMLQNGADVKDAIESLFTPEAVENQHLVFDKMMAQGSAVFDGSSKPKYTGKVAQGKRVDILVGLPAAGKSTLANALSAQYQSRIVDSDDAKKFHKDYAGGANSTPLHNESRFITDQALAASIGNGDNVILPVVGHSYDSVKKQIDAFKAAGYNVHLHNVQLPWGKAISRTMNRMIEDGRYLDLNYIAGTDEVGLTPQKINDTFDQLNKEGLIDGYAVWNNDVQLGQPPVAVGFSDAGEVGITAGAFSAGENSGIQNVGRGADNTPGTVGGPGSTAQSIQALKVKNQTPAEKRADEVKAKLKSPQDIATRLVDRLGFGNYMGSNNFGRERALGFWDNHGKYLAVKTKELGNYTTTMHEIGHGIADKLNLTGTANMVNNLVKIDERFKQYDPSELPGEAMAEFFWRYMESEDRARKFAGDQFYDNFEKLLMANPAMYKSVQESRQELQQWVAADADARVEALIKHDRNGDRGSWMNNMRETIRDLADFIQKGVVDRSAAAAELSNFARKAMGTDTLPLEYDVRANALMANHSQKQATAILTDSLTDANHTIIGDGLGKRLRDIGFKGTEQEIRDLEVYALALHAINRNEQRKEVFGDRVTDADLQKIIDKYTGTTIEKAEQVWQEFRKDFLQAWMVDTGYWSQEFFDRLNEMYPHYVPTYRIKGGREGLGARFSGIGNKKYTLHAATGSSEDIYSPFYSFIGMTDQIVSMVNTNQAALAFDRLYQENPGMGIWARQIFDEGSENFTPGDSGELNNRQQQLFDMLNGQIPSELMEQVLDVVQSQPGVNNRRAPGLLRVQRPDGTVVRYQVDDPYLFNLLAGVQSSAGIQGLRAIGNLTRTMSMLTTGSNPLFAMRNAVRDYQNSVNYGTWAKSYISGIKPWMQTFFNVWRGDATDTEYKALGGGGWTRIDQNNAKSMRDMQESMFGEETTSLGKKGRWAGKKLWSYITMERLNEVIEQTSRQVEYRYGQHDRTTPEGRQRAFQAAQEVTTDFSRRGNSALASVLQKTVPFFNASTQGIYRTGRQFTQEERGRAGARFAKTVINTALTSALASGLIMKFCDDDEKEEFVGMLSDGLKANHLMIPNPLKGQEGQPPFLRIPLAQDPLGYAVHNAVTNAIWNGTTDEDAISLMATADVIIDNLNPLGSGSILQPWLDASHNRTWYGGNLIRSSMSDWTDKASQYNEDTPGVFRFLGRLLNESPEVVEYMATQYTGFLGATLIPALTYNDDGSIGGLDALMQSATKKWTADPRTSNDVTNSFYDFANALNTIKEEAVAGRPQGLLAPGLTQKQVDAAYLEAEEMLKSTGLIGRTKTLISDSYKAIDAINANSTLTDAQKYTQTSEIRKEMMKQVNAVNEQLQAYETKYMKGGSLIDHFFSLVHGNKLANIPTAEERLPQVFKDDAGSDRASDRRYIEYAQSVYQATGNANVLPHPAKTLTIKDVDYTIPDDEWDRYTQIYRDAYMAKVYSKWDDSLTDEQKKKIFSGNGSAHAAGMAAMREAYAAEHGLGE